MTNKTAQLSPVPLMLGECKRANTRLTSREDLRARSTISPASQLYHTWCVHVFETHTIPHAHLYSLHLQGFMLFIVLPTSVAVCPGYKTYNYSKAMYRYTYQRAVFESERGSAHDRHEKPSQQAQSKRLESPTYLNENYSTLPLQRAYLCAKSPPLHAGNCYFLTKDQLRTHMTGYSQPLPANSFL